MSREYMISDERKAALDAQLDEAPSAVELIQELRDACVGHPHAKIAWPHRLLHEAADALAAKDTALAEMRGDRDGLKAALTEEFRVSNDFATKLIAERAELERARKALEPFAKMFDAMSTKADDKVMWGYNDAELTYGDFRNAARALGPSLQDEGVKR